MCEISELSNILPRTSYDTLQAVGKHSARHHYDVSKAIGKHSVEDIMTFHNRLGSTLPDMINDNSQAVGEDCANDII